MKRSTLLLASLGISIALFSGCTPGQGPRTPAVRETPTYVPSSEPFRKKAILFEEVGEIQRALYFWRIADRIEPAEKESSHKIDQLEAITRWISKRHFRRGVAYYKKNQREKARREFLIVLRYDPYHEEALSYVKERLAPLPVTVYIVLPEDTFGSIAAKVYKDPEKSFLIAALGGLNQQSRPIPGQVLSLPILDTRFEAPPLDIDQDLNLAKEQILAKDYPGALMILEPLIALEPKNPKIQALINEAYYEWGILLNGEDRPVEALKKLNKVAPTYRDIRNRIILTQTALKKRSEEHYRRGLKYFVDDDLDRAIKEWERALYLDPSHKKARKDMLNAKKILEHLKKVE